jgi:hypothetical protein
VTYVLYFSQHLRYTLTYILRIVSKNRKTYKNAKNKNQIKASILKYLSDRRAKVHQGIAGINRQTERDVEVVKNNISSMDVLLPTVWQLDE